jgi:hypothetical protein
MNIQYVLENLGGLIFCIGFVIVPFDPETGAHSVLIGAGVSGMGHYGSKFFEDVATEIRWLFRRKPGP